MVGKLEDLNGQRPTFGASDLTGNDLSEETAEHSWIVLRHRSEILLTTDHGESSFNRRPHVLRNLVSRSSRSTGSNSLSAAHLIEDDCLSVP